MNKESYNIGVIGYGNMARYHQDKAIKPNCIKFTCTYDIEEKQLQKARDNGLTVYQKLDDLLADREVDIVLIATSNDSHKKYAIAAMEAGKHVICEKPAALNSEEVQQMIAASVKNNVLFTVHQNRRMDKDYRIIRKILEDDTLGDVFRIESRVQGSRGIADTWRRRKQYGGGMMYDWGVHLIDQLLFMIDSKVTSVYAEFQYISQKEVDDNFRLTLNFENGLSALIEIGTCNYIMLPLWYVAGKKGSAQIDYWNLEGRIYQLIDNDIKWEDEIPSTLAGPSITLAPRAADTMKELPLPEPEIDEGFFYRNLVAAIEGKEELYVKPSEVLRTMKIIDLAFQSGELQQAIKCYI